MNLHPLFVHFPIACLSIYTILEVITMFVPRLSDKLLMTKRILLFVGAAFAFISLQTGEQAQALRGKSTLIHTHEEFAEKAYMTYVVLAVVYILQWLSTSNA